ncbi:phage tail sheath family protein [Terriglobus albidus]|uniref:Phage tail sheath family protein n=1 Tax=Terriglobus albidus TaxID=1592106 RepID=A0A5B9ED82_9BACT|nr:phage tail sheath C-terminal domain-containing protein [Terriglobus albidus]QEE29669.1 phage tail sheath family protein [Terriglobus albidus]
MKALILPGLYLQEIEATPRRSFHTGVPVFLAHATVHVGIPRLVLSWAQFVAFYGINAPSGLLAAAVRGFFDNGGELCYVYALRPELGPMAALDEALDQVEGLEDADLICLPDLSQAPQWFAPLQRRVVEWCDAGAERFAILDTLQGASPEAAAQQVAQLKGRSAAVYSPWLVVDLLDATDVTDAPSPLAIAVPPCGHIAGSYARNDRQRGVFYAPANRSLSGIRRLDGEVFATAQGRSQVNWIRSFPGRGLRVWGASTIDPHDEWRHISVRRVLLTLQRWLQSALAPIAFEPSTRALWARVRRTVGAYLEDLYRKGALAGASPEQAFYLRCDDTTNTAATREAGMLVAEIGIAPVAPAEFIVVRLTYSAGELTLGSTNSPTTKKE